MPDKSKLPKWAQQEIEDLERKVRNLEDALDSANNEPAVSDTFIRSYVHGDRQLGVRPTIGFGPGLEARLNPDGSLEVRSGWKGLIIEPQVTNVVTVRVKERN